MTMRRSEVTPNAEYEWPVSVKHYNGGEVTTLELYEPPTLAQLRNLQEAYGIPDEATITADCDCFGGYEGPQRTVEISWVAP